MATHRLTVKSLETQFRHDAAARAAEIRHHCDLIRNHLDRMCAAIDPISSVSDPQDMSQAAEAVVGAVRQVVMLALECAHESGRLLSEADMRSALALIQRKQ